MMVREEPTLTKPQIDQMLAAVATDLDWADDIRLARTGQLYDCHGNPPYDADALIRETDADDYRASLARNDISTIKPLIQRYADLANVAVRAGSLDERLVGRALLKLLADKAEKSADNLRQSVYPYLYPEVGDESDYIASDDNGDPIEASTSDPFASDALQDIDPSFIYPYSSNDRELPEELRGLMNEEVIDPEDENFDSDDITFDRAWQATIDDLIANRRWDAGRAAHAESTRKLWIALIGNAPLHAITKKDAIAFRRALSALPDTYHRDRRWRDFDLFELADEVVRIEQKTGEIVARISTKTVNRHISQLKRIWLEFVTLDFVDESLPNPFDRLHMSVNKSLVEVREERDQFTTDELRILFAASIWTGCKSASRRKQPGTAIIRDWKFWVPLIGAFSGMRREEICSLKVGDFEKVGNIWIVNLRSAKMRLKTPGSPRYIPIHDTLLKIGLLHDLLDSRKSDEWLFSDLTPSALNNRRGEPFGKWFTPLRRELGIYRQEVVFHSFRHTVATALHNAEAHPPFIEEITGHESGERKSELSRYTKGTIVQKLKETIDRLDYGIDFSHLMRR